MQPRLCGAAQPKLPAHCPCLAGCAWFAAVPVHPTCCCLPSALPAVPLFWGARRGRLAGPQPVLGEAQRLLLGSGEQLCFAGQGCRGWLPGESGWLPSDGRCGRPGCALAAAEQTSAFASCDFCPSCPSLLPIFPARRAPWTAWTPPTRSGCTRRPTGRACWWRQTRWVVVGAEGLLHWLL